MHGSKLPIVFRSVPSVSSFWEERLSRPIHLVAGDRNTKD